MKKGIYCLEGLWAHDLKNKSTVLPILELLEKGGISNFIHHTCATKEELGFFLEKWKKIIQIISQSTLFFLNRRVIPLNFFFFFLNIP